MTFVSVKISSCYMYEFNYVPSVLAATYTRIVSVAVDLRYPLDGSDCEVAIPKVRS